MSLTTRCPSCETAFKVVPDQLRISEGWVRCGHCGGVFDASAHLLERGDESLLPASSAPAPASASGPAPEAAPAPAPAALTPHAPTAPPRAAAYQQVLRHESREASAAPFISMTPGPARGPVPVGASDHSVHSALLLQTAHVDRVDDALETARGAISSVDSAVPVPDATHATTDDPAPAACEVLPDPEVALSLPGDPLAVVSASPATYSPSNTPDTPGTPDTPDVPDDDPLRDIGFVRAAERRVWWSRPGVAAGLAAACIVLVLGLALQVGLHERDRVAAAVPALRPLIVALCRPVGCAVRAARQIDAVVIEASAFNRRGNDYLLSVELRSAAAIPVAMPALELTLTDAQDRTLLRRVLLQDELRAPDELESHGAWSGGLAVRLLTAGNANADAAPVPVAGYRLLAFYP